MGGQITSHELRVEVSNKNADERINTFGWPRWTVANHEIDPNVYFVKIAATINGIPMIFSSFIEVATAWLPTASAAR